MFKIFLHESNIYVALESQAKAMYELYHIFPSSTIEGWRIHFCLS